MRIGVVLLGLALAVAAQDDRRPVPVRDRALGRKINASIDLGIRYLRSIQWPDGSWSPGVGEAAAGRRVTTSFTAGHTCLALYALCASGVPKSDPSVRAALRWIDANKSLLASGHVTATYTNALLILALTRVDPKAHRKAIHAAADRLVRGQLGNGMWTYVCGAPIQLGSKPSTPPRDGSSRAAWRRNSGPVGKPDNSNTQFAVLGLWAAYSIADYDVPSRVWKRVERHFSKTQHAQGWWPYDKGARRPSSTMTAAGMVSLVYARAAQQPGTVALGRFRNAVDVRRAKRILPTDTKSQPGRLRVRWEDYYWIYSLERVGTVLRLPPKVWYEPGARRLVKVQASNGQWPGTDHGMTSRLRRSGRYSYETSLALLFLMRATYPPSRGVTTPKGSAPQNAVITKKERLGDLKTATGLAQGFARYHLQDRAARDEMIHAFGIAGPKAVDLFVRKLGDPRVAVRATALELLTKLVDRPFLFDPAGTYDERRMMLDPIETWRKTKVAKLRWDASRLKFVR